MGILKVGLSQEPWLALMLKRGHYFGLHFQDGWVFFQVYSYEDVPNLIFDGYDSIPADSSNATQRGAGLNSYWLEWYKDANDTRGIFWEEETNMVLQAFEGVPFGIRRWHSFPQDVKRGNLNNLLVNNQPTRTTLGYYDGRQEGGSPFDNPTGLSMMFVPNFVHVKHATFNDRPYAFRPMPNLKIRRLQCHILNPEKTDDINDIRKIITREQPCMLWSPGLYVWTYDVRANLKVDPLPWDGRYVSKTRLKPETWIGGV